MASRKAVRLWRWRLSLPRSSFTMARYTARDRPFRGRRTRNERSTGRSLRVWDPVSLRGMGDPSAVASGDGEEDTLCARLAPLGSW